MAKLYFHYKNKPYKYLGTVKHSETLEDLALYETLYHNENGKLWVRPKDMFFEDVVIEGVKQKRFAPVEIEIEEYEKFGESEAALVSEIYKKIFNEDIRERFESRMKHRSPRRHLAVAKIRGEVVGFKFGYAQNDEVFMSSWGGVASQWRGVGVASKLMETQHRWLKNSGFKYVDTVTMNKYREMISLNLRYGFEIVGSMTDEAGDFKLWLRKNL